MKLIKSNMKPYFLILVLFFTLIIPTTSCQKSTPSIQDNAVVQEQFNQFLLHEFKQSVTNDSITLHYTLKNPSSYDIEEITPTFGDLSISSLEASAASNQETLKKLKSFSKEALTEQGQIDYEIFKDSLVSSIEGDSFLYYNTILSPVTGLQAQMPILLSEYTFHTSKDVEHYLTLLNDLDRYFNQILDFEEEKSRLGTGMQDFAIVDIQNQCQAFLSNPENNYLITSFDNRIQAMEDIDPSTKKQWQKLNREKILKQVIPAYENLIKRLDSLKGKALASGGLCNLKGGRKYYEYLVAQTTGTTSSITELEQQIQTKLQKGRSNLQILLMQNHDLLDQYLSSACPLTDPTEILSTLQEKITKDFPKTSTVFCNLKTVDPSLAEHISPAFYLTPPIDDVTNNVIYINHLSSSYQPENLYPTLAHEGYPGHLFQNVYFYETNPHPIRSILNFGGYSEGWATYAEYHSYETIDYGQNSAAIATLNQFQMDLSLGLCSLTDIGVNYHGWDLAECKKFLSKNGISQTSVAEELYHSVIEEPANYLKYYIGFLQFESLRNYAKEKLGSNFDLISFHKSVLNLGPAPFSIVEKTVKKDLKIKK